MKIAIAATIDSIIKASLIDGYTQSGSPPCEPSAIGLFPRESVIFRYTPPETKKNNTAYNAISIKFRVGVGISRFLSSSEG